MPLTPLAFFITPLPSLTFLKLTFRKCCKIFKVCRTIMHIYMYAYIDVLHTLLVWSYIFLTWSPQAVGWRPAGHHFYDASCSWSSGADKLFLERNASVTMCSLQFVMPMHLLCSTIYIYICVCISW